MTNAFVIEKLDSGMHCILLHETMAKTLIQQFGNRVICTINNAVTFHCAILPKKEGGYFIIIGSTICKQLKLAVGKQVMASFSADETDYQFAMPEELQEVLATDHEADLVFKTLTAGNKRGLMYLLTQVKSSDKRIERALKIAEKLKHGITSPRVILK